LLLQSLVIFVVVASNIHRHWASKDFSMRKLLSLIIAFAMLCLLLCAGGANAAVTKLDECTFQKGGVTTFTYSGTNAGGGGALTNSVMLPYIVFLQNSAVSGVTASWNGSAMTAIAGASGSPNGSLSFVQLFGILNPASGTNDLVVNWSGAARGRANTAQDVG
jgi:hypothetical protein